MSARIEDVLAEHYVECTGLGEMSCGCRETGWIPWSRYREHVAKALNEAGFGDVAQAHKDALLSAADDVRRVREQGLRPGETYGPNAPGFEQWLRKRAEDSPAPVECQECGETVRHSACSHEKDICPGCWPGLCHGCQADSAELCGDATKAGDVL